VFVAAVRLWILTIGPTNGRVWERTMAEWRDKRYEGDNGNEGPGREVKILKNCSPLDMNETSAPVRVQNALFFPAVCTLFRIIIVNSHLPLINNPPVTSPRRVGIGTVTGKTQVHKRKRGVNIRMSSRVEPARGGPPYQKLC
jgi:hypothetical protein